MIILLEQVYNANSNYYQPETSSLWIRIYLRNYGHTKITSCI
jgi:hypothetical protein